MTARPKTHIVGLPPPERPPPGKIWRSKFCNRRSVSSKLGGWNPRPPPPLPHGPGPPPPPHGPPPPPWFQDIADPLSARFACHPASLICQPLVAADGAGTTTPYL